MDQQHGEVVDVEPIENTGTELATVMQEGDPEAQLALLEAKAKLAPRMNAAINAILVSQTYPEDWTQQGEKMCLSSAGAERVARLFSIKFSNKKWVKEAIKDDIGVGYRYVYECDCSMNDRTVFAQGAYSTRDKFLGSKGGEYRPLEDINENNIRNAAYHICIGNGIKALLGLRGISVERFNAMMSAAGEDPAKAKKVNRGKGTQGGTSQDDTAKQQQLAECCMVIAQASMTVESDGKKWIPVPISDNDTRDEMDRAMGICELLSTFTTPDDKTVKGKIPSNLKAKWLNSTLAKAKAVVKDIQQ